MVTTSNQKAKYTIVYIMKNSIVNFWGENVAKKR